MINRNFAGRMALLVVLASAALGVAGCASIANAQEMMGQNRGADDQSGAADSTPEASEMRGGEKITAVVEMIDGSSITINGVTVMVKDPAMLDGLKVGDTITVELETEDGGVVVAKIEDGEDDHGVDLTPEATDDHGVDLTPEAGDDHGVDLTPEVGDDHGVDLTPEVGDDHGGDSSTPEPGDDNGVDITQDAPDDNGGQSSTPEPGDDSGGGNRGGGDSGSSGKGGGKDDGGGHK